MEVKGAGVKVDTTLTNSLTPNMLQNIIDNHKWFGPDKWGNEIDRNERAVIIQQIERAFENYAVGILAA